MAKKKPNPKPPTPLVDHLKGSEKIAEFAKENNISEKALQRYFANHQQEITDEALKRAAENLENPRFQEYTDED